VDDAPELLGLRVLLEEHVAFILVGGLACVVQGAPFVTQDVDIVHARSPENVKRLLKALLRLDARYRGRPGDPIPPSEEALSGPGHQLLMTRAGALDALGTIEQGAGYEDLIGDTIELDLGLGAPVHVLSICRILALKANTTHLKDLRTISALRAVLDADSDPQSD
jgi:hypothetical protein